MTDHVRIDTKSKYLQEQSDPTKRRFAFAYTITISNDGKLDVTLLSRHWIIIDGLQVRKEVRGDGVVGQQPIINSGSTFEYTSAVVMDTPVGTMQGSYEFKNGNGAGFTAKIEPFLLASPASVH
ncbi:MAG: Co2+/Mg2+ efflux protein ApaG [Cellvibrionales bacterium TMED148]|nr:Co2+/Mg2+ efflux protein ApaG [Porticoccaceae bacterium]RPG92092.1 MAG: Co2+/Mg2+ efflux protein ApaG [Cellvibrionales bacterium TMED148]|tara:strand:+ start:1411 stop:1782 length:372 start_codon:yes stop_codon:yes gene_type:complete